MEHFIKKVIKKNIPAPLKDRIRAIINSRKLYKAKKIFNMSDITPAWLGWKDLEYLYSKYPLPEKYPYDPISLENRGLERANHLLNMISGKKANTMLEIGCFDGMVSCILQSKGNMVTAIDIREWFDERAGRSGVKYFNMDASHLKFEDESFDCIFTYDSFEHFSNPELVMQEAYRVLKKGGYLYISFGNSYFTPKALHIYDHINVPYCQLLFTRDMLNEFVNKNKLREIAYDFINGWSVEQFRELWEKYSGKLKILKYKEIPDLNHLDIIINYPSCFKSKTDNFDNLIVCDFEILFLKT
jgi:ubiquinone/menaquinone biosynthesis C-methylase UbiE